MNKVDARDRLLAAAATVLASEKGDPTGPHYDAQLEYATDYLDEAAREYAACLNDASTTRGEGQ